MSEPRPVQVVPVIYNLILWSSAKVGAFLRVHRFTIGYRLVRTELDLLAFLVTPQFKPARHGFYLFDANLALE